MIRSYEKNGVGCQLVTMTTPLSIKNPHVKDEVMDIHQLISLILSHLKQYVQEQSATNKETFQEKNMVCLLVEKRMSMAR
ncbi:hypothetical protein TNCT_630821 [Trichonephila clavata]|uniref:Uncharacterized protein n=1 Tax=Trichonephila clavata TaxID=2740835 RepID=A0A8X6FYM0_TRICU|nr:hypothetical protein TNCT_630821 [Trichonephila clavata]